MANFNYGYPATYPQMAYQSVPFNSYQMQQQVAGQQQQMNQQPMQQSVNSNIVWVKRSKEAEDYLVAPNNSVIFMDEAMTHLYMKSADQFGRPSFTSKKLIDDTDNSIVDVSDTAQGINTDNFITKEEFDSWVNDVLEKKLSDIKSNKPNQRKGGNNHD